MLAKKSLVTLFLYQLEQVENWIIIIGFVSGQKAEYWYCMHIVCVVLQAVLCICYFGLWILFYISIFPVFIALYVMLFQGAISLKCRSFFSNTMYTSLGALYLFSEMVPRTNISFYCVSYFKYCIVILHSRRWVLRRWWPWPAVWSVYCGILLYCGVSHGNPGPG